MPPLQQHATFTVKIGKPKIQNPNASESNVPLELMNAVAEIVVDSSLYLPDMFTLRVNDPQMKWIDDESLFAFGNEVIIEAQAQQQHGGAQAPLFHGEITALEPNFDAQGMTTFVVRGYAKSHRLHLGRHSRTFTNQSDRDMIETIANEAGLTPDVDKTEIRYDYVMQKNQTNMEFLIDRAERIGYQVFTEGNKLYVKKGDFSRDSEAVTLDLGQALRTFRPRVSTAHQATKVRVRGWDAMGKTLILGEAEPNPKFKQGNIEQTGGAQVQTAFKMEAPARIVNSPVASIAEANALAQGLANDLSRAFIEAEGTCFGNPQIKAGMHINLTGLGQRFSGRYFITAASHIYDASGYTVTFTVSGREPHTIHHLLTKRDLQQNPAHGRVTGVVIGLVTNLNDPENLGRVKVKFPWLADDAGSEIESTWAKVVSPMAGQGRGFFFLPEVDDEVLVSFEHGDVNCPYVVGALWSKRDQPSVKQKDGAVQGGKVVQRIIRSRAGHEIILDDTDGKESITVRSHGGHMINLTDAPTSVITISDQSKRNAVVIDATQQMVSVQSGGNLDVRAVGNINLQAGGMLTLAGQGGLSLSSPAGGNLEATGPLSIKSTSAISIDGGLMAELRGVLVKIN